MMVENENKQLNEELAKLYEESVADIKEGQIVKGTVVQISDKEVLVDVGYKSEGMVYKSEFTEPEELKEGDKIDVIIESKENDNGMVVLSHEKAKKFKGWQNIVENYKEGDVIEGKVFKKVRGGFMVDVGMEAFLPASLSVMQEYGGSDNLIGHKLTFAIVKINVPRKNIVLSRKEIVEEKRKEEKKEILESLNKGDIVKGIVRNITDFGAFVDIGGGITGLLHITDMSWGRISHPGEVVKIGDELEVKVLDFDKESVKVSLGLKQKEPNPWDTIDEKYPESSTVTGKVVNIMPYGVFVELENGIEGLIHISEFSWGKKFNHPSEKFNLGDEVQAMVLKTDKENQKLSLGIKQLEKDPWEGVEDQYHVGDRIKGKVNALTDYGAFVELENGIEGLVHVSDFSWTKRVNHPKEMLTKGDEVDAMILNVDEQNRRIALGIKQLSDDPWDEISQKYKAGTEVTGKVTNITNFGVFVELEKDLEGLLHVSEIPLGPNQRMEDVFEPGDDIKVTVIHIDGIQKKIALTHKEGDLPAPKEDQKEEASAEENTAEEAPEKEIKAQESEDDSSQSAEEDNPREETKAEVEEKPSEESTGDSSQSTEEETPAEGGSEADKPAEEAQAEEEKKDDA
ncbi:MAG: 30S ribosomal protein S1 [Candidatus Omnitrophica bacterium]|nr:30S ribosomal protein S1 [Candidatus Omnitrophota bacterium]